MICIEIHERTPLDKTRLEHFLKCIGTVNVDNGMMTDSLEFRIEREEEGSRKFTARITIIGDAKQPKKDRIAILAKALDSFDENFEMKIKEALITFVVKKGTEVGRG